MLVPLSLIVAPIFIAFMLMTSSFFTFILWAQCLILSFDVPW